MEEASVLERPSGTQNLAPWTLHDVVSGIVAEAARGYAALDRFLLRRDQRVDPTTLKCAIDLGVGIAGITGHGRDRAIRDILHRIDLGFDRFALVHLAGRHGNVETYASRVVNRCVRRDDQDETLIQIVAL